MGRNIKSFEDWHSGIAYGHRHGFEKYTQYIFRTTLERYLSKLREINDTDLLNDMFDRLMVPREIPSAEIEWLMSVINDKYQEQIKRDKERDALLSEEWKKRIIQRLLKIGEEEPRTLQSINDLLAYLNYKEGEE